MHITQIDQTNQQHEEVRKLTRILLKAILLSLYPNFMQSGLADTTNCAPGGNWRAQTAFPHFKWNDPANLIAGLYIYTISYPQLPQLRTTCTYNLTYIPTTDKVVITAYPFSPISALKGSIHFIFTRT